MITKEGKLTDEVIEAIVNGGEKNADSYRNSIFQQMVNEASGNSYGANSSLINHPSHKARYINKEFQTAEEVGQDWTNYYNKLTDAERSSFSQGDFAFPKDRPITFDPSHHTSAHSNSNMSFHEWGKPNYNPPHNVPSIYKMNHLPLNLRVNEITKFERSGLRSKEWIDDQIRMMEEGTGKTWDELINLPEYINMKKYGGSVKQSPYDKEKLVLKNQDGIIADMMQNGAFLPKFKMGAEKSIDLPDGNKYKIKKKFDKARELPFIGVEFDNIDDRVYYDKDDEDGSGNFNIIDIAQQMYDQKRAHEKTKELIKKYRKGEKLSNIGLKHLISLGIAKSEEIKDPIIEELNTPPPTPSLSLEELDVSKDIKNVTLDGKNLVPIDDQIGMYMAHVSNKYKDTPYEKKLKRIYDKLNRVYYNDSKNSGLSIIEYMKSLSNN